MRTGPAASIGAVVALVLLAAGGAAAGPTPWVEFGGGLDVPADAPVSAGSGTIPLGHVSTSTGFAVGLAGGLDFGWLRGALRADLRRGDVEGASGAAASLPFVPNSGRIGLLALMPALALDLPLGGAQLHADVGVGAAQLRDTRFSDWAFAYAVGGGSYRPLAGPVGLDLVYRYTSVPGGFPVPGSAASLEWSDHAVTLALRLSWTVLGD